MDSDIRLWKVFKVGDNAVLLNVLWGSSIDDDEDAECFQNCFNWVRKRCGDLEIAFPLPKNDVISDSLKEEIFQLILEALKGSPRIHVVEGDIMEEYELPKTVGRFSSYFKKFTIKLEAHYWW